jgi:hypothetical protein
MTRLIRLLSALAVVAGAHAIARSEESACKLIESGYGYIKVADRVGEWTYVLKASGPQWKTGNNGWHSSGFISCKNCSSVSSAALGQFYLTAPLDPGSNPSFKRPKTAAEHVEQNKQMYADRLSGVSLREAVNLGPLSGYAVVYHLIIKRPPGGNGSDRNESILNADQLVISLADGCIAVRATIDFPREIDDWTTLDSFLKEVTITKTPSVDAEIPAGGTAIYRPDGKPAPSLFELKSLQGK